MNKQKNINLCVVADAALSAVLMLVGYIFSWMGGADFWGIVTGIGSVAVPVVLIVYGLISKKLLLSAALLIKTIIVSAGVITSLKVALECSEVGIAETVLIVLAVLLLCATCISLKDFSYSCFGIKMIILLAVGTIVIGLNTYESISLAADMKEFFGNQYYVAMVLQNLADIFLWVAIVLIGLNKKIKKN